MGMTRGRPPLQAIREARAIAEKLGDVVEALVPGDPGRSHDILHSRNVRYLRKAEPLAYQRYSGYRIQI